jgi:hypothetical protein
LAGRGIVGRVRIDKHSRPEEAAIQGTQTKVEATTEISKRADPISRKAEERLVLKVAIIKVEGRRREKIERVIDLSVVERVGEKEKRGRVQ